MNDANANANNAKTDMQHDQRSATNHKQLRT